MERREKSFFIAAFCIVVIGIFGVSLGLSTRAEKNNPAKTSGKSSSDKKTYSTVDPHSPWVIVNRTHLLPQNFVPLKLTTPTVQLLGDPLSPEMSLTPHTSNALEKMLSAAKEANVELSLASGYRSFELQKTYYEYYIETFGKSETDHFSAPPGASEHQTGLAADLSLPSRECYLEACFADTPEGKWLAANAHTYGFIIRYPLGGERSTGYNHEPWHIRFVGIDLAKQIYQSKLTMETFFEYTP